MDDPLTDTILDGELVIDVDPKTQAVRSLTCRRGAQFS
jgi:hypothetical protein